MIYLLCYIKHFLKYTAFQNSFSCYYHIRLHKLLMVSNSYFNLWVAQYHAEDGRCNGDWGTACSQRPTVAVLLTSEGQPHLLPLVFTSAAWRPRLLPCQSTDCSHTWLCICPAVLLESILEVGPLGQRANARAILQSLFTSVPHTLWHWHPHGNGSVPASPKA